MDDLLAARVQMEVSLAFHMIFAAIGIGMPLLMVISEGLYLRNHNKVYLNLAKKWAKVTGLLFAIGAVSGTALSFELGLLWPVFMEFARGNIAAAFALEGYAFFTEAIFLGLYLYGWNRLSPLAHWLCGIVVAVSGALSGILVLSANAWMQHPTGFEIQNGKPVNVDPMAVLFNPGWFVFAMHSTIAGYIDTSFAVAAVYAYGVLRRGRDEYHSKALTIAMSVATLTALVQPIAGDLNARFTTQYQPAKLAAMEGIFATQRGAPLDRRLARP
ncbi:MAG: cytochrome ubiquinol oxidase subunit I [Chloroflexota bacterium]|nr:cytochrome ubiquinol oxidase subunit I [Chloroflexota bacterium]